MKFSNLQNYAFLARHFRNAPMLVQSARTSRPCHAAVLWNGTRVIHPAEQGGLVGTLLELWKERCYTGQGFYTPKQGDTIVDAGAHVGLFSIRMARKAPGCRIIALEPHTDNYHCLAVNAASAGLTNFHPYRMALAGRFGAARVEPQTDRSIDHRLQSRSWGAGTVPTVPLEGLLPLAGSRTVALLKVDIEGAEKDAFGRASRETLERFERIAVEYHNHLEPGCLETLIRSLSATHSIEINPTGDRGYGILRATLRQRSIRVM
jgi:FkbM family methyltransferase